MGKISNHLDLLESDGFCVVPNVIRVAQINELIAAIEESSGAAHAMRNLLRLPIVRVLAESPEISALIEPVLGPDAQVIRGIFFDKTPEANWNVAWHQDLSIAVREKIDVPGFGPWSVKAGVVHVQPPRKILEKILTVRLHLDDCGIENAPLRVVPGSHAHGILAPTDVLRLPLVHSPLTCTVQRGGVLLMRPLILHASSKATQPSHRRVIHLEFSSATLPADLRWDEE